MHERNKNRKMERLDSRVPIKNAMWSISMSWDRWQNPMMDRDG